MTHKELIPKLIEHYQFGIDNLPMEDWKIFLKIRSLNCGICWCALSKFNTSLYASTWIYNLTKGKTIITNYPENSETREKALEYLQIRLDALKTIDINTIEL